MLPASLMGWLGLAGGAASTAGSIMDLFGGSGGFNANDYGDQIKEHWITTMRMAKRHGIHPLVAMGVNPSSGGYANVGDSTGRKLARLGQNLRRMSPGTSPVEKAQVEHLKALTELTRKQTALLGQGNVDSGDVTTDGSGPGPIVTKDMPADRMANYVKPTIPLQAKGGGRQVGEYATQRVMWGPDGNLILAPTEGLEDLVSEDIVAKMRFYGPQIWRMIKGWSTHGFKSNQDTPAGVMFRNAIRLYLVAFEAGHPAPKDKMYVWNNSAGTVKRVPKKKFRRLFDNTTKYGMRAEFVRKKKRKAYSPRSGDFGGSF